MEDTKQMIKYAAVGIGAVALGAMLYYLSKEDDLDYKKFNLKELKKVYDEIELEGCCIYARNYAHMLSLKQKKEWEPDMLMETKTTVENEIIDKVRQVISDHSLSVS